VGEQGRGWCREGEGARPRGGARRAIAMARGRGSRCSAGAVGEDGRAAGVDLVELGGKISEEGEEGERG
jgi:hypothetical protein